MNELQIKNLDNILKFVDERAEYHLRTGDYDTADALFSEFYEWLGDDPIELICVRVNQ
jgi:hypothetical protein